MFSKIPLGTDQNYNNKDLESLWNNFYDNNTFIFSFKKDNQLIGVPLDWFFFSFILGSALQIENRAVINSSEEIYKELDRYKKTKDYQSLDENIRWYLESNLLDSEVNLSDS